MAEPYNWIYDVVSDQTIIELLVKLYQAPQAIPNITYQSRINDEQTF